MPISRYLICILNKKIRTLAGNKIRMARRASPYLNQLLGLT
jgi:hypothetical protein